MPTFAPLPAFAPRGMSPAGLLAWIHIGDLHMVHPAVPDLPSSLGDLHAIVRQLNTSFAGRASFVYLPGDNADHGDNPAYTAVREALDQLHLPWCAIVGDHDVHEKSHANFLAALSPQLTYSFTVGRVRFLALNAFDVPEPPSFTLLAPQLDWITQQLGEAHTAGQRAVLLLHCYPGDLKEGRERLQQLIAQYSPLVVDMGHTHYNEISNDGETLYTATRSTGQVEEGPVGFSVTTLDFGPDSSAAPSIAWRFFPLAPLQQGQPAVLITQPSDSCLITRSTPEPGHAIRAAIWSAEALASVTVTVADGPSLPMHHIASADGPDTWQYELPAALTAASATITVTATTVSGHAGSDSITCSAVAHPAIATTPPTSATAHEDYYVTPAWPEHGLLGTQLGPNKNGRKW
jgi:Icc protein